MPPKHRILIVEDHTIVREGLQALLQSNSMLEVVGGAEDGQMALKMVENLAPDLVIMDLSMPRLNGIEAIREIKRSMPETKILVLTVHKSEQYIQAAFDAGARGYVVKEASRQELMTAIQYVLKGTTYISPEISERIIEGYLDGKKKLKIESSLDKLTAREKQILKLIAEGYKNKEIADLLFISVKTTVKHRSNLMKKLHLHSVAALTAYAIRKDIIDQ